MTPGQGPYSLPCQRCTKRNAMSRKIDNTRTAWVFAAATNRATDQVRLCGVCFKTVESLTVAISKAKERT